ncbi:sulfotransferase domain-containing protein [Thiogranum longum]|uniref:Sulfotransferase domain-containing protein n=1 Tax=Thiogranum longum TaxID=1537524 RepID=A0A4V2PGU2_9GAMM|nr:sulfotransferase domain-containing protein [Thiogranum longum]TCK18166.1 sulfotransferase domain-containing protein [Thiogranum longum]
MNLVFHIGYHKTGTSWLQQCYFRQHPGIVLLGNPEQPWEDSFLSYLIATPDTDFEPGIAKALLVECVSEAGDSPSERKALLVSAERLSGHPFSGGYDNVRIARRIAGAFVDAKIICVVRNQRDMISSVYKQLVSEGFPGTLEQLVSSRSWKTTSFNLAYFEYDRLISQYHELFGKDRVCLLQYELMRKDLASFLGRLCTFMGVDHVEPNFQQAKSRVNPSLPDASIGMVRRLNYFRRTELYPFPVFNLNRGYRRLRSLAVKLTRGTSLNASRQDGQFLQDLCASYSESNARLASMLGDEFIEY